MPCDFVYSRDEASYICSTHQQKSYSSYLHNPYSYHPTSNKPLICHQANKNFLEQQKIITLALEVRYDRARKRRQEKQKVFEIPRAVKEELKEKLLDLIRKEAFEKGIDLIDLSSK